MTKDLICMSHLRWDFVYQRPQHLLSRFAKHHRVFYMEEPGTDDKQPWLEVKPANEDNIWIVLPHLTSNLSMDEKNNQLRQLIDKLLIEYSIDDFILWYYAPMAIPYTMHLQPGLIVFDCMDELSAFKFAPAALKKNEAVLLQKADIVFTGGHNLFNAKKHQHQNIYPFPSSIDKRHFAKARTSKSDPPDQKDIPHPRLGFYGVIDERMNLRLLEELALLKPDWHLVLLGPVVKIESSAMPRLSNIHYLGSKNYNELPHYLSGWDIAIMPFAINESTEYISPTKTPEYLAGGKPVISTRIKDVVDPYAVIGLVKIADTATEFITAANTIFQDKHKAHWIKDVDHFLKDISWDKTWENMNTLMTEAIEKK